MVGRYQCCVVFGRLAGVRVPVKPFRIMAYPPGLTLLPVLTADEVGPNSFAVRASPKTRTDGWFTSAKSALRQAWR